jgi:hypothetical protein
MFYLMEYNSCPDTVTNFSTFYMLHGREPVLPTIQGHQVKLSRPQRNSNEARLRQLHNSLQLAYRLARRNIKKSHSINKHCYDRRASERIFIKTTWYIYMTLPESDTNAENFGHHCLNYFE